MDSAEITLSPLKLSGVLTNCGIEKLTRGVSAGVASARASPSPGEAAGRKKNGSENEGRTGSEPEREGERIVKRKKTSRRKGRKMAGPADLPCVSPHTYGSHQREITPADSPHTPICRDRP
ncbi:hypothetical protein E2C01_043249 [Portunus trituberculatus]|uniref:Uncharacterized protein n=1 Tax=Portunus trituberculatus TaxID=210409 RepID=A0A5B7FVL0_PORTR|nr:hypothetical protein [Portunus trituberculatus]